MLKHNKQFQQPRAPAISDRQVRQPVRHVAGDRCGTEMLEFVLGHVGDAIVETNSSGMVRGWNPAAEEVFGRPSSTVLGRHVSEAVGAPLDPRDAAERGGVIRVNGFASDGRPLLMRVAVTITVGGYLVICVKDTARRRADDHFKTVLNHLDEGVVVFSPDGQVQTANRAATRIWGPHFPTHPGEFSIGARLLALYDTTGQLLQRHQYPVVHTALTGESVVGRVVGFDRSHDERVWLSMSCRRLESDDPRGCPVLLSFIDITAQRTANALLAHRASHDALTELPNREHVLERITEALTPAGPRMAAVLFIDLDNLKPINDSRGHDAGDAVLRAVADRLRATARAGDVVARLGGDEFVRLVMGPATHEDVDGVARRVLQALSDPIEVGALSLTAGASIGVTTVIDDDARNAVQILRDADQAMYQAKRNGRNRIQYFR